MSGRRHHGQQPDNPLGGKIKEEVLSALKLLFRNAEQQSIPVGLEAHLTAYETGFRVESIDVPLEAPAVSISDDPIRILAEGNIPIQDAPLAIEARLSEDCPCAFQPALCHEPVFDDLSFEATGISFENVSLAQSQSWLIPPLETASEAMPIESVPTPPVKPILDKSFQTRSHSLLERIGKIQVRHDPRLYALPVKKALIPPHRFSVPVREKFRQALAEKAGTFPANVQLKVIFDRMHMMLYSSIQPDDAGNLLCTPRNELMGRNLQSPASQQWLKKHTGAQEATYLAIGLRLDTKEDIRALVPVDLIAEASGKEGKA